MNKTLKTGLIIVGALAALFAAAAVILAVTFDPNDYKDEIAKAVKESTGRELVFEGDISLNFFPWLGLEVGPVALDNAQGFQPKEMVRVNKAMASIRVLPLLAGDVMIGEVVLDGFTLNLAVDKRGKSNWADLSGKDAKAGAPEASPGAKDGAARGSSAPETVSMGGREDHGRAGQLRGRPDRPEGVDHGPEPDHRRGGRQADHALRADLRPQAERQDRDPAHAHGLRHL